jgi:hypothetical protein
MPRGYENSNYDPSNLNKRTEQSFRHDILLVENENQISVKKDHIKKTGINYIYKLYIIFLNIY